MVKAAIFDFDGTLADSSPGIFATAIYTMKELGFSGEYTNEQLRKFVGPPLRDCFRIAFGLDESLLDDAVAIYRREYQREGMFRMSLFPGMKETLIALRDEGILIGAASNKGEATLKACLDNLGITELFDSIHGSSPSASFTKGDIIKMVLNDFCISGKDAVMIGDTDNDRIGAEEAGVHFLPVSYGFGFEKQKGSADTPEDIVRILKERFMIEKIETKNAPAAIGPYSQAVKANGMVFASGQIPIDPATGNVVEGTAANQAKQVFKNIEAVLEAAGTEMSKVVKATVFLKSMDDFASVNEVYAEAFKSSPVLPARSAVQVGKLPKDVQVEIEVIALA